MPKLSKSSQSALDAFDSSAKTWGWESDQGTGRRVDTAEKSYDSDKLALARRLHRLERENKRLRKGPPISSASHA